MAKKQVVYLSMTQYRKVMRDHHKKPAAEQKAWEAENRFELDLTETRKQALAKIREVFGPGEPGWRKCQENDGCHWTTYRLWDDDTLNVQPQARSLLKTALACGIRNPKLFE